MNIKTLGIFTQLKYKFPLKINNSTCIRHNSIENPCENY